MQRIEAAALQPGRELGRLLVALDQRSLYRLFSRICRANPRD